MITENQDLVDRLKVVSSTTGAGRFVKSTSGSSTGPLIAATSFQPRLLANGSGNITYKDVLKHETEMRQGIAMHFHFTAQSTILEHHQQMISLLLNDPKIEWKTKTFDEVIKL